MHALVLLYVSSHTTYEVLCFNNSNNMIGAKILKRRSHDPEHSHYVVVCHPKANTWLYSTCMQNLAFLAQPCQRYDCGFRNWKWVM